MCMNLNVPNIKITVHHRLGFLSWPRKRKQLLKEWNQVKIPSHYLVFSSSNLKFLLNNFSKTAREIKIKKSKSATTWHLLFCVCVCESSLNEWAKRVPKKRLVQQRDRARTERTLILFSLLVPHSAIPNLSFQFSSLIFYYVKKH